MDLETRILAQLTVEEKKTNYVYDDASGKPFVKGTTLQGFLTCAIGVNLSEGLDEDEIYWLSRHRLQKKLASLARYSWFTKQDDIRKAGLASITYNVGLEGLLHWPHFLSDMDSGQYEQAAIEIHTNQLWISQVHFDRAHRIEEMIRTGQWPGDIKYG